MKRKIVCSVGTTLNVFNTDHHKSVLRVLAITKTSVQKTCHFFSLAPSIFCLVNSTNRLPE